jgi:hypothetical protein
MSYTPLQEASLLRVLFERGTLRTPGKARSDGRGSSVEMPRPSPWFHDTPRATIGPVSGRAAGASATAREMRLRRLRIGPIRSLPARERPLRPLWARSPRRRPVLPRSAKTERTLRETLAIARETRTRYQLSRSHPFESARIEPAPSIPARLLSLPDGPPAGASDSVNGLAACPTEPLPASSWPMCAT